MFEWVIAMIAGLIGWYLGAIIGVKTGVFITKKPSWLTKRLWGIEKNRPFLVLFLGNIKLQFISTIFIFILVYIVHAMLVSVFLPLADEAGLMWLPSLFPMIIIWEGTLLGLFFDGFYITVFAFLVIFTMMFIINVIHIILFNWVIKRFMVNSLDGNKG